MTKVFISYSHVDEPYRKELEKHLSGLKRYKYIDTWNDREIIAGQNWGDQISIELEEAKIILLLLSSDFLASNYCYDIEMKRAIERYNKREAIVVPIILRFCDWSNTPFSMIQCLPLNAKPVKDWPDQDQAFLNIVDGIKALLNSIDNAKQDSLAFGVMPSPQEQLSKIYKKALSAKSKRDLEMALFEINEYKTLHPITFEIEELEKLIIRGIKYEIKLTRNIQHYSNSSPQMSTRVNPFRWIKILLFAIIISLLVFLIIKLIIK